MTESLILLFRRDLDLLADELLAYEKEEHMWQVKGNIKNSGGNLSLHIIGNLNHFIGATLGNTGYIRAREEEFNLKNKARRLIMEDIHKTKEMITSTLNELSSESLSADFPIDVFANKMTTEYFLIHLTGHLTYHLGQINYHRRLMN